MVGQDFGGRGHGFVAGSHDVEIASQSLAIGSHDVEQTFGASQDFAASHGFAADSDGFETGLQGTARLDAHGPEPGARASHAPNR